MGAVHTIRWGDPSRLANGVGESQSPRRINVAKWRRDGPMRVSRRQGRKLWMVLTEAD